MALATPAQRRLIRQLMKANNMPIDRFTIMHRRIDIPDEKLGDSVDAYLDSMKLDGANALIQKLERL